MAGKNKGGREIKKPKQAKKASTSDTAIVVPKIAAGAKRPK